MMTDHEVKFLADRLPLITLTRSRGFVQSVIKGVTDDDYSHAEWTYRFDAFSMDLRIATQGFLLRDKSISTQLAKSEIKFIWNPNWSDQERLKLRKYIQAQLDLPPHKRLYDWAGILGHLFGIPQLNFSKRNYCSEHVGDGIKQVEKSFQFEHPTPADINRWSKERPEMVTLAKWDADEQKLNTDY